tara:strand:+ start:776 stop:1645 length:870 start_codon:yes stop_codon:yes gene_type:complete
MKNLLTILLSFSVLMIGCNTSSEEPKDLSDAELIEMIQNAEKIVVPASELPTQSQNTLDQEYYEYDGLVNWKASGLGYMTELVGRGHRSGMYREAYFNMEGRKLDLNDRDDGDNREEWKCFDFVFPITFNMPDGSAITVASDDEESWTELKLWYDDDPDTDQKPILQFPIDINFEGDITITVITEEELDRAYVSCKREKDYEGFDCGQLVLPASYSMADGSTITVENESGYQAIRDWQEANPDAGGEVTLAYPFDMTFKDADGIEITITINNDDEYRVAQIEYCLIDRD